MTGYQKISEDTLNRLYRFIEKKEKKMAKRGGKMTGTYSFDDALSLLLSEVGF